MKAGTKRTLGEVRRLEETATQRPSLPPGIIYDINKRLPSRLGLLGFALLDKTVERH